jgi:heterodisulfide reductase subunit A-like polyferredoxin
MESRVASESSPADGPADTSQHLLCSQNHRVLISHTKQKSNRMNIMERPKDDKELLIIGGGIAGLSAGIYARRNGYSATILEMGQRPGRTNSIVVVPS